MSLAQYVDAPENITGLSGIVNKKKTKRNIDLSKIESDMLKTFKNTKEATAAVDEYKEEMRKITQQSGIDFGETWDPDDLMGDQPKEEEIELPSLDDDVFGADFMTSKDPLNNRFRKNMVNRTENKTNNKDFGGSDFWDPEEADDGSDDIFNMGTSKPRPTSRTPHFRSGTSNTAYQGYSGQSRPVRPSGGSSNYGGYGGQPSNRDSLFFEQEPDRERQRYTRDQIRQKNIDAYMNEIDDSDIEGSDDIFEQAKSDDEKHHLLDQIDTLRNILEEDDVDISHIPEVDGQSTLIDIKNAHKMLIKKNDSRRCSSMAEEGVLMVAYALEDVFDGKRTFFGRFKPNLTGWHTTAQSKLRRMRFETSNIVSSAIQTYGIGNMGRIGLELIPSMIIYSKRKQASSVEPDLVDTAEFTDAIRDLNDV